MLPDAKLHFANLIQVRAGAAATQALSMLKPSRVSTAKQILGRHCFTAAYIPCTIIKCTP